jgi:hypothetical protein
LSAFKKAGLVPFDPQSVIDRPDVIKIVNQQPPNQSKPLLPPPVTAKALKIDLYRISSDRTASVDEKLEWVTNSEVRKQEWCMVTGEHTYLVNSTVAKWLFPARPTGSDRVWLKERKKRKEKFMTGSLPQQFDPGHTESGFTHVDQEEYISSKP